MKLAILLSVGACLLGESVAMAQERAADSVLITGQADLGSSALGGARGGVEWVHDLSARSTLDVGVFTVGIGDTSWTYGRFGDLFRRGSTTWWGDLGVGGGRLGDQPVWYQGYRGGLVVGLRPRRLYAEVEGQYVRLGSVGEGALGIGALVQPVTRLTSHVSYHRSFSSGKAWHYLAVRSDVSLGAIVLLGGFTGGHCGSCEVPSLLVTASREFFAGTSVTINRVEAIGTVSMARMPAGEVARVLAAVRVPLGSVRHPRSDQIDPIGR